MRTALYSVLALGMIAAPQFAAATTVLDAAGDFAPGYTGAAADLDVRSFTVLYNRTTQIFSLSAIMDGIINPATAGVYIIGVNTGTGPSAPFAALGAPNVRFNQTIRVNKDGTASVGTTTLSALIAGAGFSIDVPLSLFPARGSTPASTASTCGRATALARAPSSPTSRPTTARSRPKSPNPRPGR